IVPKWWGVQLAQAGPRGGIRLTVLRDALSNPEPNAIAIASLLWRTDALSILESRSEARLFRDKSRRALCSHLASLLSAGELRDEVCKAIKFRASSRSAERS